MENEEQIITLQTFYDPLQAHLTRTILEDNGIHCFITDESSLGTLYNQALGGIKLNIFEHDLEKCRAILAQHNHLPNE